MSWAAAGNLSTGLGLASEMSTLMSTGGFGFQAPDSAALMNAINALSRQIDQGFRDLNRELIDEQRQTNLTNALTQAYRASEELAEHASAEDTSGGLSETEQEAALRDAELSFINVLNLAEQWVATGSATPELVLNLLNAVNFVSMVRVQAVAAFDDAEFGRDSVSNDLVRATEFLRNAEDMLRSSTSVRVTVEEISRQGSFAFGVSVVDNTISPYEAWSALAAVLGHVYGDEPGSPRDFVRDGDDFVTLDPDLMAQFLNDPDKAAAVQAFLTARPWDYDTRGEIPSGWINSGSTVRRWVREEYDWIET